jgi:acyl-coenzyme A thioesterase PaaI-like protein
MRGDAKDKLVGEIDIDHRHLNKRGIVHGGALWAFADDLGGANRGANRFLKAFGQQR